MLLYNKNPLVSRVFVKFYYSSDYFNFLIITRPGKIADFPITSIIVVTLKNMKRSKPLGHYESERKMIVILQKNFKKDNKL